MGFRNLKPGPSPLQALVRARPGLGLNGLSSAGSGLEARPGTSLHATTQIDTNMNHTVRASRPVLTSLFRDVICLIIRVLSSRGSIYSNIPNQGGTCLKAGSGGSKPKPKIVSQNCKFPCSNPNLEGQTFCPTGPLIGPLNTH